VIGEQEITERFKIIVNNVSLAIEPVNPGQLQTGMIFPVAHVKPGILLFLRLTGEKPAS
jgi:hypothetical protein